MVPETSAALRAPWAMKEGKAGREKTQAQIQAGRAGKGKSERDLGKGRVTINCSLMAPEDSKGDKYF